MRRAAIVVAYAVTGWALCFATIGIAMALTTDQVALVVHAVTAPIFFFGLSLNYHTRFAYTPPMVTAVVFTGLVMALDLFVVAGVILRSMEMFTSLLGTWIPFSLILVSTWLTGLAVTSRARQHAFVAAGHR